MDNLLRCSINPDTDRAAKFVRTKGLVILNGFLKSLSELLFGSEYRGRNNKVTVFKEFMAHEVRWRYDDIAMFANFVPRVLSLTAYFIS